MYQGWPWHCVESWHNFWRRLCISKCSICLHWSSLVYFVLQWRSNPPLANVSHITSIITLGKSMNDPSKRSKIEKNYLWLAKITEANYVAWYQLRAVFICNCQSFLWKRHVGRIPWLWILCPVFQCYITAKLMMSKWLDMWGSITTVFYYIVVSIFRQWAMSGEPAGALCLRLHCAAVRTLC